MKIAQWWEIPPSLSYHQISLLVFFLSSSKHQKWACHSKGEVERYFISETLQLRLPPLSPPFFLFLYQLPLLNNPSLSYHQISLLVFSFLSSSKHKKWACHSKGVIEPPLVWNRHSGKSTAVAYVSIQIPVGVSLKSCSCIFY